MKDAHRRSPRAAILTALLGVAFTLGGCKAAPRTGAEPKNAPATAPVSASNAGDAAVDLTPYTRLRPATGAFEVVRTGEPTREFAWSVAPAGAGRWRVRLEGLREIEFVVGADGAVAIAREDDGPSGVRIVYDPPLLAGPAAMAVGESRTSRGQATVAALDTGRVRGEGSYRSTLEFVGVRRVETAAGAFDAAVLRNIRELDLGVARVRLTIETSLADADAAGEVMERVSEETTALGLFTTRKEEVHRRTR